MPLTFFEMLFLHQELLADSLKFQLLASVCFSLVFIGIRVFYSVAALSSQRADLNPSTGSLAIRVILGFLPGLIATLAFLAAGFKTQGSAKLADDGRQELEEPSHKPRSAPYV